MIAMTCLPNGNKTNHPERADEALAFIQDIMERSQMPFIVLRDAAYQLQLEMSPIVAEDITVGVLTKYAVDTCISTLESLMPKYTKDKHGYDFCFDDAIPCHIRIIKKQFNFLKDPEQRSFGWGWVYIPNPFNRYWATRSFV